MKVCAKEIEHCLFISGCNINETFYGGGKGSKARYELFNEIINTDYLLIEKISNIKSVQSILERLFPPLLNSTIKKTTEKCIKQKYDLIIVDDSVSGSLVKYIKEKTNIPILCLYQNCEYDYIDVRFGYEFSLKKAIYKKLAYEQEKLTTHYADWKVVYTERDKQRIQLLYKGKVESIIPLFLNDQYSPNWKSSIPYKSFCLLFGPVCKPNIEGFRWFVQNVSPYLIGDTVIAGKGFENFKSEFDSDKVHTIGFIDDIRDIYTPANVVAIPLFSGGGMKVKTVEALMFGKNIVGTTEAFEGFNIRDETCGILCKKPEEFIEAINTFFIGEQLFNTYNRERFLRRYSKQSAIDSFKKIIKTLLNGKTV